MQKSLRCRTPHRKHRKETLYEESYREYSTLTCGEQAQRTLAAMRAIYAFTRFIAAAKRAFFRAAVFFLITPRFIALSIA